MKNGRKAATAKAAAILEVSMFSGAAKARMFSLFSTSLLTYSELSPKNHSQSS